MDAFQEDGAGQSENFITDCTIDTDIIALIPEDYVDVPMEKIRIYKELDAAGDDKVLMHLRTNLEDRFGPIPEELDALFDIVRIRTIGRKLGFEKIIIKNGIMICFFVSNPMSSYFRSKKFAGIIDKLNSNQGIFELKQKDSTLRLISREVGSSTVAHSLLSRLLN